MAHQTLVAIYDSAAQARDAADDLEAAGIGRSEISLHPNESGQVTGNGTSSSANGGNGGFMSWLLGKDGSEHETKAYSDRLDRGGSALSVRVDDGRANEVTDIMERHHPSDIDDDGRGSSTTHDTTAHDTTATKTSTTTTTPAAMTTGHTTQEDRSGETTARTDDRSGIREADSVNERTGRSGDEERIQLVEEEIAVGKRQIDRGRVRVRSYVVETPVSEQVTLRDETVSVDRQAVSDGTVGADPFQERTIEFSETDEEAVVAKNVRVTEEVVVRRDVDMREETVTDTLRHTEVEVDRDDDRPARSARSETVTDDSRRNEIDGDAGLGAARTTTTERATDGSHRMDHESGLEKVKDVVSGESDGTTDGLHHSRVDGDDGLGTTRTATTERASDGAHRSEDESGLERVKDAAFGKSEETTKQAGSTTHDPRL